MIDLLKYGRANGARRLLRGVTSFYGASEAVPARTKPGQPGRVITVEAAGRDLNHADRTQLLLFGEQYLDEIGSDDD